MGWSIMVIIIILVGDQRFIEGQIPLCRFHYRKSSWQIFYLALILTEVETNRLVKLSINSYHYKFSFVIINSNSKELKFMILL